MSNPEHTLVYEFEGTRNLFSNPINVPNLNGDKYEYFYEIESVANSASSIKLILRANVDSSTNYRSYLMRGLGSSPAASVDDATSSFAGSVGYDTVSTGIQRAYISGDSSEERYLSKLNGGATGGNTDIGVFSGYYKNQILPITSLQISQSISDDSYHTLRIYQIPKTVNLENYELVDEVVFENRSSDIVFDNLDGDRDGEYLIQWSADANGLMKINGNGGAVYTRQRLYQDSGVIKANNSTVDTNVPLTYHNSTTRIFAKSGRDRLTISSVGRINTQPQQQERAVWYTEQLANITNFVIPVTNATGKVSLYRRHSNKTIDPVPMVTVAEIIVDNEDISAGYTISGINGDSIDGAIKIEVECEDDTGQFKMLVNGNTSSVYAYQFLNASNSTVTASHGVSDGFFICNTSGATSVSSGSAWLYPKSGQARPLLTQYARGTKNLIDNFYSVYGEEVSEVSQFTVKGSNTNLVTGKFRISVPKQSEETCGAFTIVKN